MSRIASNQLRLKSRPSGLPQPSNWMATEEIIDSLAEGQVLVAVHYLSLDPAMRGWMNEGKSYIKPVEIGEVMRAGGVGKVVESKHPKFKPGDYVVGMLGVQEYAVVSGEKGLTKVDSKLAPLPVYLGTLGMPGMTAYFGLLDTGKAKAGDTVVVSAAAGAVGSVAGQIAKIKGCRVIGIAGGPEKCKYVVEELGFDAAIDYKFGSGLRRGDAEVEGPRMSAGHPGVKQGLKEHCPNGVDVYFDNVGGDILDAVLTRLARNARIVICGSISQYNSTEPLKGPANYMSLLVYRASMTGMVVFDYADRYAEAAHEMAGWMMAGKLKSKEDIVEGGVEKFPEALLMLFRGENFGKLVLKVADE